MTSLFSKLGLLLIVFTLAHGESIKGSTEKKPATEKAKLRDWFFRLSLRNDLIKFKEVGQDYLPVVKLRTEDGEGEDFSILLDEDHPHPNNNCSSESGSKDKEMRFVMRGLDQEFMCTEITKNIPDVPEERSMSQTDTSRRGPGINFMEEKDQVEKGEEVNGTSLDTTGANVEVELVSKIEDSDDGNVGNKNSTGSLENEEARIVTGEDSFKQQSATEKDCASTTDTNLIELITDFNNMVETITSSSVLEVEPTVIEKESANREESGEDPEIFAEVIGVKNETETPDGFDPLIDHLNGVASHQQFQDPIYAKAIQDLIKDFRAHNISEASWDGEKLNAILDKIEELVTGDNPGNTLTDKTSVEVVTSESKEPIGDDVKQIQQELEALHQISSQSNQENPAVDQPDISTVNETLGHLMSNLHNLVDTVNGPKNPEARMSGSQGDGRVSSREDNSESNASGSENEDRAKNMELIDSLLSTNMEEVIEDLRKFVDVVENKPDMRSADSSEDGRGSIIIDANETSTEPGEVSTAETDTETLLLSNVSLTREEAVNKVITTDATPLTEATEAENIAVVNKTTSVSEVSITTENTLANGGTTEDSGESAAQSLNDASEEEDYDSNSFINLLSSWKRKFFIILGCFIVSMVLFLIIIAVLIYKVQQNKPNPDTAK